MTRTLFESLLILITNFFRIFVMMRYAHFCFKKKDVPAWIEWLGYFGYFAVNSACYFIISKQIVNLLTNIVPFFLLTFFRQGKLRMRILSVGSIYAVSMVIDSIFFSIDGALQTPSIFVQCGAASALAVFCIVLLLEKLTSYRYSEDYSLTYIAAIIAIPLLTIIVGIFTMKYSQYQTAPIYVIVECVVLLLINVIVFVLLDMLYKNHRQEIEKMQLHEQNKTYLHQIELVEQSQNRVRYLKHDMKNHLNQIRILAQNQSYGEIITYVDEAIGAVTNTGTYIDSGNQIINSILNLKLSEADAAGAEIHTEITIPNEMLISAFDINIILGNLLDNAITALKQCERKVLYVKLYYAAGSLYIAVKNTYQESETSKKEISQQEHGLGLKSVRSVLEQYDGELEVETGSGVFSVLAIMCT